MKYSEIFYSIQGKGQLVGLFSHQLLQPALYLVRYALYQLQPEDKDISVEDAVTAILTYNCPQVVLVENPSHKLKS